MIRFLTKGLLRDRSRSLFPILIIAAGVMITVVVFCWLQGVMEMVLFENARLDTGHVKVVTRAYEEMIDQKPFDLGFLDLQENLDILRAEYPDMIWLPRTNFGGLLDIADENGETISQGEVICMGVDLLNSDIDTKLLNLEEALVTGNLPVKRGEILLSHEVAEKMKIQSGDEVTIITSTIYGSMSFRNYIISGTLTFGVSVLDKGAAVLDLADTQYILDMENGAAEILGFFPNFTYDQGKAELIQNTFNNDHSDPQEEFSPVLIKLSDQNSMDYMIQIMNSRLGQIIFVFVFIMSLVLWNSGLMNGIRRYGEIGVRMAIGESKKHLYGSMILESVIVALLGSMIGTAAGLAISYYLQQQGIDISSMMSSTTIIMSTVMRAKITGGAYYVGFIPGVMASIIGAVFSGIGIFRRDTSQLFKELEI